MAARKRTAVARGATRETTTGARTLVDFSVAAHRLAGAKVSFTRTPNTGGALHARYLVFHYTAGSSAEGSVRWLTSPEARASAHLVVGRDGSVTQLAPFNVQTWHAGVSNWQGLRGLNAHSIGVELDNAGLFKPAGDRYQAWFGRLYPKSEAVLLQHKHHVQAAWWHLFTAPQLQVALSLAVLLVREYGLSDVLGHDDIAPGRKQDPGPAFPLDEIRSAALGRNQDGEERRKVTASRLNVRSGPGVEHQVSTTLERDTEVLVLESRDRWSRVEALGIEDVEGWVHGQYLALL